MKKFTVQELLEICGDMYIYITDYNKVNSNGCELVYWEGWNDDYYTNRPFGEYIVKHISSYGSITKNIDFIDGKQNMIFNILYVMIEKE